MSHHVSANGIELNKAIKITRIMEMNASISKHFYLPNGNLLITQLVSEINL